MRLRLPTILMAAVVAAFLSCITNATAAYACSDSSHCYGVAYGHASGMTGVSAQISPSCLSVPSGAFVTDQLWWQDSSATHWVEAGFLQLGGNLNLGGITAAGRYGFWADLRPNSSYSAHVFQNNPSLAYTTVSIRQSATNQYTTVFGGYTGSSSNNTMAANTGAWGQRLIQ